MGSVYIVGGAAAGYRRSVLDEVGGFDPGVITEDIEMSTRIQHAGKRIAYAPDALVWTEGPQEFAGWAKQRLRWKHGRLVTFARYRDLFFSLRRHHNTWLSWFVLPVAAMGEFLLLLQPVLLALGVVLSVATGDFWPLASYLVVLGLVVVLDVALDPRPRDNLSLLVLAPMAWLPLTIVDAVELQALVRSLWRLARGRGVEWQSWQRRGVGPAGAPRPSRPAAEPGGTPTRSEPSRGGDHAGA